MTGSVLFFSVALGLALGGGAPQRPPIVGVAHIALKTNDLAAAKAFYGKDLGFAEAFHLAGVTYFKVNDHQYIALSPDLKAEADDRLSDIAFETTNVRQLRDYLASRGVEVPAAVHTTEAGDLSFMITDPNGRLVEFIQYTRGSIETRETGRFMPDSRISERISHVGYIVTDRAATDHLFRDILGFHEIWHGGMTDNGPTDWVAMRVPDGKDHLEYMLNVHDPSPHTRGVMNHLCLGVPSVDASYKTLLGRGVKVGEPPKIGRDGKWQLNLYDPNLTRTELMEPKPVQKPCCAPFLDE